MSVRRFLWEPSGISPANRGASLRAHFGAFQPTAAVMPVVDASFDGQVRGAIWGDMTLLSVEGQGTRLIDRALEKARAADHLALILVQGGAIECHEPGEKPTPAQTDQMVIRSVSGAGEVRSRGAVRLLCVIAPRIKLRAPAYPCLALGANVADPACRVLWTFLPSLEDASRRQPASVDAIFDVLSGLLRLALGGRSTQVFLASNAGDSYAERIDRYLRLHFGNPALTPAMAAQELGISVRYLNMLLAPGGRTFRRVLVGLRLNACRTALADPDQSDRTIAEIAFNAGFNDLSQFNRQFRLAFGLTPSALRATYPHITRLPDYEPLAK